MLSRKSQADAIMERKGNYSVYRGLMTVSTKATTKPVHTPETHGTQHEHHTLTTWSSILRRHPRGGPETRGDSLAQDPKTLPRSPSARRSPNREEPGRGKRLPPATLQAHTGKTQGLLGPQDPRTSRVE